MKILGIDGSTNRRAGKVSGLLAEALEAAGKEAEALGESASLQTIRLLDVINFKNPFYDYSRERIPKKMKWAFEEMSKADGFIFATPVNWFNMSSPMKCFTDWLTARDDEYALIGKVAGIVSHCNDDGGNQAAMSMVGPLSHMGIMFPPCFPFYRNQFVAEHSQDQWQMKDQVLVGQNVARLVAAIRHNPRGWRLSA